MARVARRVGDKRVLKLVRRFLEAGVMAGGVQVATDEGTPQGSPLSPLLANIMLDDLDAELEARGHAFVRYADDVRVYVASERAATRVLDSVTTFVERRLKLKVNRDKSTVARATARGLLGFGFFWRDGKVDVRIDPKAKRRVKAEVRAITRATRSIAMDDRVRLLNWFIGGWCAYFALADTPSVFDELDEWTRRRLRKVRWKEWKRPRTRVRMLRRLGMPERAAREWGNSRKGAWRIAGSAPLQRALPRSYWTDLGLTGFRQSYNRVRDGWRTAGCGPARPVVWEGAG